MNWTGGKLQRHSKNVGNGVANRQKQHFAKVRTQLQNGTTSLACPGTIPFRPSFIQDDHVNLGGNLPQFGVGSSRHARHSKRRIEGINQEPPRRDEMRALPDDPAYSRDDSSKNIQAEKASRKRVCRKGGTRKGENPTEAYSEDQLLEANRRRLLERQDWVGLVPSHPVHMHFRTNREKNRIGKRRKIAGLTLLRPVSVEKRIRQPLQHAHTNSRIPYMSGAIVTDLEDIRIRIGTDALASQMSIQQTDPLQHAVSSQAELSDPMLFDLPHDVYITSREKSQYHSAEVIGDAGTSVLGRNEAPQKPYRSSSANYSLRSGRMHQPTHEEYHIREEANGESRFAHHTEDVRASQGRFAAAVFEEENEHIHEGTQETRSRHSASPFRLIFEPSSLDLSVSSLENASRSNCAAADLNSIVALADWEVGGDQRRNFADSEVDCRSRGSEIVDDTPWKTFLAIPEDGSSHSTSTHASKKGLSHQLQAINGHFEGTEAICHIISPARATAGNQTTADTLSFPGSVVTVYPVEPQRKSRGLSREGEFDARMPATTLLVSDADNAELWRTFVFGWGNSLASDIVHDANVTESVQNAFTPPAQSTSNRVLASSHAAGRSTSLMLSTPSRSVGSKTRRLHDNIQIAWGRNEDNVLSSTKFASASMYNNVSRSISSPVSAAYRKSPSNHQKSHVAMAGEGRRKGRQEGNREGEEESVTQGFSADNVSRDGPSSSSHVVVFLETSQHDSKRDQKGLGQRRGPLTTKPSAKDTTQLGPRFSKMRNVKRRLKAAESPSIFDFPDSDEMNLVDPDKV